MDPARRAFTLVEMLVTLAIIAILATIVLASMQGAKNRGNDTGVESDLGTIQTQGVLYYGVHDSYGADNTGNSATCGANANGITVFYDSASPVQSSIQAAVASAEKDANGGALVCASTASTFIAAAMLSDGNYWCVDNTATPPHEVSADSINDLMSASQEAVACPAS